MAKNGPARWEKTLFFSGSVFEVGGGLSVIEHRLYKQAEKRFVFLWVFFFVFCFTGCHRRHRRRCRPTLRLPPRRRPGRLHRQGPGHPA